MREWKKIGDWPQAYKNNKNIHFHLNHWLYSLTFTPFVIKIRSFDSNRNKRKNPCISYTTRKKSYFLQKSLKYVLFLFVYFFVFWPSMRYFQQVGLCIWINKGCNNKFGIKQNQKQILLLILLSVKYWHFNQLVKINFFYLIWTTHNTYVNESWMPKHIFNQKLHLFTQLSEHSTCTHLHQSALESGGQSHLKTRDSFCMPQNNVVWRFQGLVLKNGYAFTIRAKSVGPLRRFYKWFSPLPISVLMNQVLARTPILSPALRQYTSFAASGYVRLRGRLLLNFSTTYAVDCGA